ncbi:hypothetical protein [Rathayibacter toxicus]|uniref:hypothetical protein n=2 Tax=Rathayibacter toxicus TaxID=145458 RepID=UPI000CE7A59A|nr:hypothetical protein [Rathayibacter toxicus]QOD10506.1 hypothetical protein BSG36_00400 [Rathayibacter toxicus]QWL31458.1 hypothetical protein E2R35_00370 [Rathayibacter toxicus]QWL33549.1 hypothetical protein E2R36_00370 [Rathayibacter toxicus]QWL35684.1 hypothetical protein E2R37_00370 [Rathayibacter toxicus]QWL37773.1 hypothetical protein E2R38_00370 [Rathayibacter toxicus]
MGSPSTWIRWMPHHRQQGKWPFHVDPYNPLTVWLELDDQFIPLDWRSPYNGAPMADEVWRIARAQAAARGENEPSTDDLNELMRRVIYRGNAVLTKRQKKRAISAQRDPLAITNPLPITLTEYDAMDLSERAVQHHARAVHDSRRPGGNTFAASGSGCDPSTRGAI